MNEQSLNPKIGLVTVLYNGKEVLPDFFESLAKQTYKNYVLYVVDNSPNDEALDLAKELAAQHDVPAEFVNNNANLGVAKGNNQGIELSLASGCEFVLLLNNDIDFESNVIEDMVHYAVEHDENIIVPKIYYAGTNKIWFAGGYFDKWRAKTPHRGDTKEDIGQFDSVEYIEYAPTCFMLIRSVLFKSVGLMDEKYFVYYDDSDWIWRSNQKGFLVVYYPEATVNHKVSFCSGGAGSVFSVYYDSRNRIYFIKKNLPVFYKLISLAFFYVTRVVKFFKIDKERKNSLIKGVFDGRKL